MSDGAPQPPEKRSIADQAMDRFRKRARVKEMADAELNKERKRSRGTIFSTSIWLILWTAMNIAAMFSFLADQDGVPWVAFAWFAVAAFVWWQVFKKLMRLIRGDRRPGDRPENF